MILEGDYHTHTIYSCGKLKLKHATGTILENAQVAKQKGIKNLAITDHGFSHMLFGLSRKNLEKMKKEIEEAKKETGVNILLGVEANIISSKGDIDLKKEDFENFDIILLGFHSCARPKNIVEFFKFFLPNVLKFKTKKQRKRNTEALKNAILNNKINIISHPAVNMPLNFEDLILPLKKTGTYLEINGKRIAYTPQEIELLKQNNIPFIVDSDAHSKGRVGEVNKAINYALKNKIDFNLIKNIKNN